MIEQDKPKLLLSEYLKAFRIDRPSEWQMDSFIARAKELEADIERQRSSSDILGIKVTRSGDGRLLLTAPDGKYFDVNEAIGKTFYLSAAPSAPIEAQQSAWISVNDKLPGDGVYVQVWLPNYGQMIANMTKTEHGAYWWCRGQEEQCHPSHWQPLLPAPDKSEIRALIPSTQAPKP